MPSSLLHFSSSDPYNNVILWCGADHRVSIKRLSAGRTRGDRQDRKQRTLKMRNRTKRCFLLQVLCGGELRAESLHGPTHQVSLQEPSTCTAQQQQQQQQHGALQLRLRAVYLRMCGSAGSPQHRHLLLAELVLTGSHVHHC